MPQIYAVASKPSSLWVSPKSAHKSGQAAQGGVAERSLELPGGMLFIVPVHSQHRGRLFLPFADPDPKSAEVRSKVLLLARQQEIKNPAILDPIRR